VRNNNVKAEAQAASGRWPIPAKVREKAIARMVRIIDDQRATKREKTAAARVLVQMDALNLAEEKSNDGFTQEELLAKWQEAVADGVAAELSRREVRRIESSGGEQSAAVVPASTVPAPKNIFDAGRN